MPPRQLWIYLFGCWVALGTAVLHLIGMVVAPLPAPAAGAEGFRAAAGSLIVFPDGTERALGDVLTGFNLAYVRLRATMGGVGLAAARRDGDRRRHLVDIARVQALVCLALLVTSLVYFFLIPTLLVAVMLVCFTLGAVRAPE